ncbi:ABC transporter ATP-binding protein [Candidatus Hodarchaeum mangrovi]
MLEFNHKCPICLENVQYSFNEKNILSNISVKVESEGITGVVGPSGSGKTTFLKLINRLISPTKGRILFNGEDTTFIPVKQLRKKIGLVQQRPFLFPGTVKDNLLYGPNIWKIKYSLDELYSVLSRVALPPEFLNLNVENLSSGEQQRVSLGRTLANNPQILLLDEPTSSLDIVSEEILETTLRELAREKIKIIIVTHSLEQTKRLTDQLLFLKNGRLIEKINTKTFFDTYDEIKIRRFFKAKSIYGET